VYRGPQGILIRRRPDCLLGWRLNASVECNREDARYPRSASSSYGVSRRRCTRAGRRIVSKVLAGLAGLSEPLSLEENDDGFILRQKDADGAVTEIKTTEADLRALKATIDLWSDRRLSQYRAKSGQAQAIAAYPIQQIHMMPDALKVNVLVPVAAPSGPGCVKTRRCGEQIEWTFRQITIRVMRILKRGQFRSIRERSVFSFSSFRGFHTAWVSRRHFLFRWL
jgi:hypothetical protein